MGFLDNNNDKGFNISNWVTPRKAYSTQGKSAFISIHINRGTVLFNRAFKEKFNLGEKDFKIAFNVDGFNTAFVLNPTNGIPFFNVKTYQKSKVTHFANKGLATMIKEAYEIKGEYTHIFLKPHYFGELNSMQIYKMIAYKDAKNKFYDGKPLATEDKIDPNPEPDYK